MAVFAALDEGRKGETPTYYRLATLGSILGTSAQDLHAAQNERGQGQGHARPEDSGRTFSGFDRKKDPHGNRLGSPWNMPRYHEAGAEFSERTGKAHEKASEESWARERHEDVDETAQGPGAEDAGRIDEVFFDLLKGCAGAEVHDGKRHDRSG